MRQKVDLVNQKNPDEPSAEQLAEAIHSVMHRFRARQYRAARSTEHELTHMDGKVMGFFSTHSGATLKDLVEHSGRDKGQLARLIAGLKERGLLEGVADEVDRRNVRLHLTETGRAMQKSLRAQARRTAEQAFAGLALEERRQLFDLLERVRCNLDD